MTEFRVSRPWAYVCLGASMTLVGSYVALTRPLSHALPVLLLAWLRFGIGVLAMAGWLKKPADEAPLDARTRWLLFAESFFGNFLFTLFMITGVQMTSAASASVIMAAIPAVVAVMGWLLLGERIGVRIGLSVACAVLGVLLLALAGPSAMTSSQPGSTNSMRFWLGHASLFAAVLCEAVYSIIGKKLTGALSSKRITALINLWGFALTTPFGLYLARDFAFAAVPKAMWLLLLFYSLAASVWSVWLWMTGLRTVPASQAGIFTVFLPVGTALTGVFVLGEYLSTLQWLALGVALLGVVLATLPVPSRMR
ncbi:MAG: DMT family transporter [Brachymonas sp.]|nr:DMT family transporter [Brachymonas sp.]